MENANEFENKVIENFSNELKSNYIKNLIEGSEMAYTMVLNMINNGSTLEQIKAFLELSLSTKGKNAMRRVAGAKKVHNKNTKEKRING